MYAEFIYFGLYFIFLLARSPLSIGETSSDDSSSSNSEADRFIDTLTGDDVTDNTSVDSGATSGTEPISGTV